MRLWRISPTSGSWPLLAKREDMLPGVRVEEVEGGGFGSGRVRMLHSCTMMANSGIPGAGQFLEEIAAHVTSHWTVKAR